MLLVFAPLQINEALCVDVQWVKKRNEAGEIGTLILLKPATTMPCTGSSLSSKWPDDFSSKS